jgi:hypothetical protein
MVQRLQLMRQAHQQQQQVREDIYSMDGFSAGNGQASPQAAPQALKRSTPALALRQPY